jgi:hypothetical protein
MTLVQLPEQNDSWREGLDDSPTAPLGELAIFCREYTHVHGKLINKTSINKLVELELCSDHFPTGFAGQGFSKRIRLFG